jgi:hypothetical protein
MTEKALGRTIAGFVVARFLELRDSSPRSK